MMKRKARSETANMDGLELGNVTLDDCRVEVSIDIWHLSDGLKTELERAIEVEKVEYTKDYEKMNAEEGYNFSTTWSNEQVIVDYVYLRAVLEVGKPIDYSICYGFTDATNKSMKAWCRSVEVDLPEYDNELKKMVIEVLANRFI